MGYLSKHVYSLWWKMAWSVHNVHPKYVLFLFRLSPLINEVSDSFWRGWTICMGDLKKKNHNRWKEAIWQEFKSFLLYFFHFFLTLETEGSHPKAACAWGRNRNFMVPFLQVRLDVISARAVEVLQTPNCSLVPFFLFLLWLKIPCQP